MVTRKLPSSSFSSADTMRLKVNSGLNGAICSISLSTRPCAEIDRPGRNVVDRLFRIEFGALAARPVENVDQVAFHVEQAELEHGEQADRPCPDDQHIRLGDIRSCGDCRLEG